jgi:hypothetical protein
VHFETNRDVMRVQELFIQLFDKDDSNDDFLGEASVMLREYMPAAFESCASVVILFHSACLRLFACCSQAHADSAVDHSR